MLKRTLLTIIATYSISSFSQYIKGKVVNNNTTKGLNMATVNVLGSNTVVSTNSKGNFSLPYTGKYPVTIEISYIGFKTTTQIVKKANQFTTIYLESDAIQKKEIIVRSKRKKAKLKESPLTIESMGIEAIKATPASDFYEGLGHLKGVDITAASLGFRIINTRGFNSTSPVRSLQLIDGVDNQSPGLNFSLGNFLGSSEIDVRGTKLYVGASGAYLGPNAFNGAILITTKDPFKYQGLTVQMKVGERSLTQGAIRYAKAFNNKKGIPVFAFKVNMFGMLANDWRADNANKATDSDNETDNPGGYDAVNRYGDENLAGNGNDATSKNQLVNNPGLGSWNRTGYWESDIVNYKTKNAKANIVLAYRKNRRNRFEYGFNYGTGSTIYQGDNRISLKDIQFFQHRLEYKGKTGFVRMYSTQEDAGNSFDIVHTAILLQDKAKNDEDWSKDYANYWNNNFIRKVRSLPGYPVSPRTNKLFFEQQQALFKKYADSMNLWHLQTRQQADKGVDYLGRPHIKKTIDMYKSGTSSFANALDAITSKKSFTEKGSGFYDKSALYHAQGEKRFKFKKKYKWTIGANARMYRPETDGTIFKDTAGHRITNSEVGAYTGLEAKLMNKKLTATATLRADKNQNFNLLFSPAASLVYSPNKKDNYRISFSSAIRNPTLADQYLFYNVGRAILLGNIDGVKNLVTVESALDFINSQKRDTLQYFDIDPIRPEKVNSLELGYKSFILKKKVSLDVSGYYSQYTHFIGYKVGLDLTIDTNINRVTDGQAYRVAANTKDKVNTMGAAIGINYFINDKYTAMGNYSWNKLSRKTVTDPIIPAYNTPEHKFNIGIAGNDINIRLRKKSETKKAQTIKNVGFSINYKFVEGFLFEGSPQFTGFVPSYGLLDVQVSKEIKKPNLRFKLGASNILNNKMFQVFGGPRIGRMAYFSITYHIK